MSGPRPPALDADGLARLLREIEASKLVELELEYDGLYLRVRKDGAGEWAPSLSAARPALSAKVERNEVSSIGLRRVEVRAPMLGVFYRAPQPGAPPFVEVGQTISAQDTVGLIEVMKLFSQVPAGAQGRVAEIAVEDGAFVEHGQVLMIVEAPQ
jgi:acetyl-CoA carboxylase biotin carboxyl carrier protein